MRRFFFGLFTIIAVLGCRGEELVTKKSAILAVEPLSLELGSLQLGTSSTQHILVKNRGDAVLEVDPQWASSDDAFTFSIDRTEVAPAGLATIFVVFTPDQSGERTAVLRLDTVEVAMRGVGEPPSLRVEPAVLSFGKVLLGSTRSLSVTIENVGLAETSMVITASAAAYTVAVRGELLLAPGERAIADVVYAPFAVGASTGTVAISHSSGLLVEGTGIDRGIVCAPAELDFGRINPGACVTEAIRCENIANLPLFVEGWRLTESAAFTIAPSSVRELLPGENMNIDVGYCASSLGANRAEVIIDSRTLDAPLPPILIPVEGAGGGPDIAVTPLSIDFGLLSLVTPARRTLLVQNTGFAALEIMEIIPDTQGAGGFSLVGSTPSRVPVGGAVDVTLELRPNAAGDIATELLIRSTDRDEAEVRVPVRARALDLPPCSYEVAPSSLAFGILEPGHSLARNFSVKNTGAVDCLLQSVRLKPGSHPQFSLAGDLPGQEIIAPGDSVVVEVLFSPTAAATNSGTISFSISSPNAPFFDVLLSGTGVGGAFLIAPNELDFGAVPLGCSIIPRSITAYNSGATAVVIDAIGFEPPASSAFSLDALPSLPLELAPGATMTFGAVFRADALATYAGAIEVHTTLGVQLVALSGRGSLEAVQADEFVQLERPLADILFVIDDSCSMQEEQTSLAANFSSFIQFAEAEQIDYHLGVTTTDVGSGGPAGAIVPANSTSRVVTPLTLPSPSAAFAQNADVGTSGSGSEQGLEAARLALSSPLVLGSNAGFLRADAVLSIIFVSDEPDQSPGSVDFFVSFFRSIKGFSNGHLLNLSAIAGDAPGGCSGPGGNAGEGSRYIEVTDRTGGVFQSICTTDWARSLEQLSRAAFGFKSRFVLDNAALASTIRVFLDGALSAAGPGNSINWEYDAATNAITFGPFAVPEPGSEVRVEYEVACSSP